MKKWSKLQLDFDTDLMLRKIQTAEQEKFNYPEKRNKEHIINDALKLGIREFIKIHNLEI